MSTPTLHLICNAHLDPVWQWRWEEGCAEAISTFRTAVDILGEHPDLVFNHNEAILYQWVRKYEPGLFSDIQRLVRLRRWCISGGWFLQPDANLPGTESFFRHIAEGRRFFDEYFHVRPTVAYNFDSFGHGGGLPQILRLCGYRMYIHMRPDSRELRLPADLYRWQGVDGSEIAAYRIAVGLYHTERDNIEQRLREGTELVLKLGRDVPVFWGIGNHGGGPTREDLHTIDSFKERENRVRVVHSTPERFADAVKDSIPTAPVVRGDLQRCFTGCYTSLSRIKRRAAEGLIRLTQCESLRSATWWLFDQEYPAAELQSAWHDHLFNDFHDILPGSCTQPAEQDALDQYGRASETLRRLRMGATAQFNTGPPRTAYIPVTVLNANTPFSRVPAEVECMIDLRPKWKGIWHLRLVDLHGNELPCQEEQPESLLPFNGWRRKVSFMADVPGVGSAHVELRAHEGRAPEDIASPMLAHRISEASGLVDSLKEPGGQECLRGPLLQPLVVDDDGDAWGTDRWSYRSVSGRFSLVSAPIILHAGQVRTITESVLAYNHSTIRFHTIAYAEWPVLEFRLRIVWNEIRKRLKLSVPTMFQNKTVVCEIPGGAIERPADGEEHVHGRWLMMQGGLTGSEAGLGVVSAGQHGFDALDGEVRLSVLRSAAYCHEQGLAIGESPARKYMDIGVHDVRLLVTAGKASTLRTMLAGYADWIASPPFAIAHLPFGSKTLPRRQLPASDPGSGSVEFLSLAPTHLRMIACKRSWDGKALIVRVQETAGKTTDGTITLAGLPTMAHCSFRPFEIKTLRFEQDGTWKEATAVEET